MIDHADTAYMLLCSAFVLFMTPGLALFYGGLVRSKNVVNTMMMSFAAMGIVAVLWVLFGYSAAFAPNDSFLGPFVGGLGWLGLGGVGVSPNPDYAGNIPHLLFMVYQAMFAIITPALISGAVVERMQFRAYVIFIVLWSALVYAPVAHWVWGTGGWLRSLGALDFAGGTVVHVNAGVAALVAALVLGPRRGFPQRATPPHNVSLTMLGGGMLWFGWFGFNAGSALGAGEVATIAFVTTNTAAASAMLCWMLLEALLKGKATGVGAITGAVAGLVAITPACGFVTPMGAIAIGFLVSVVCYWTLNQRVAWGLDDTLDAFSVHGVGGVVGALATGIFATTAVNPGGADGLIAGNASLLGVQAIAVLATALYSGAVTWLLLTGLRRTLGVRSDAEEEHEGLDLVAHGERAYNELVP